MAATVPTSEPDSITAGDTLGWTKTLPDYPASDGWSIAYSLRAKGLPPIDFTTTASGDDHLVSVLASATAIYLPAKYSILGRAVKSADKYTVFNGFITVLPNLAQVDSEFDQRSHARIVLDNIRAVLENRASQSILKSNVEGVELERIPHADLITLENQYAWRVANEENKAAMAKGKPNNRIIKVRFTR